MICYGCRVYQLWGNDFSVNLMVSFIGFARGGRFTGTTSTVQDEGLYAFDRMTVVTDQRGFR